jgi:hypothetical protein
VRRLALLCILIVAGSASAPAARRFLVDSVRGDDANPGTLDAPWKSVEPVARQALGPDDTVFFERGGRYPGALFITASGAPGAPLRLADHGQGDAPLMTNPGQLFCIRVRGSYVEIEGLAFADSATMTQWYSMSYERSGAVLVDQGADHVLVTGCDFRRVGVGVKTYGLETVIRGNTFHDLVIAYTDRTLSYGAIGVSINNSYAEVSYNTFTNCRSTASPYGADGGAIEIEGYANRAKDHIAIHHNRSSRCQGFLEVTETTSSDVRVFENVSDDYQQFVGFDTTVTPSGYIVDHNTVVRSRRAGKSNVFAVFYYREIGPQPADSWMSITNNIFYTPLCKVLNGTYSFKPYDFPHRDNVFYDGGPDPVGCPLGPGDIVADPKFVDFAARDFRLLPGSPAAGKGAGF